MASFPFKPLQQTQLHLSSLNPSSALSSFKFYLSSYSPTVPHAKHTLKLQFSVRVSASSETRRLSGDTAEERSEKNVSTAPNPDFVSEFSSFTDASKRGARKAPERNQIGAMEPIEKRVILKDRHAKIGIKRNEDGRRVSSTRFKGKNLVRNTERKSNLRVLGEHEANSLIKCENNGMSVKETKKKTRKPKIDTPQNTLRVGLDMCSKRGDVVGAIKLYDLAKKESVKMAQYHYAVVLYLCSSAATGIVQPAKSGSGSRSLSSGDPFLENSVVSSESLSSFSETAKNSCSVGDSVVENLDKFEFNMDGTDFSDGEGGELRNFINGSMETDVQSLDGFVQSLRNNADYPNSKDDGSKSYGIQVSEDVKRNALQRGFEIYNEMRLQKVPTNEAIFTSVARMAMAFGDGAMAFDMVKQMKEYGINPRLRSYGPALAIFCSNADVENAFKVEKHMLENGVYPEEPELEALLKVSIEAGKGDKVYYVLHKLRTSVRQVSPTTAELIERWFRSKTASRVGKRKLDRESISQAMQNGGGGWHGKGWLGKGKWTVRRSPVSSDGLCKCCGKKLVTIDLDPEETENFAKSVASIAVQREKNSSFQKFQKWLDYYGPFEAVVDAANVGMYSQRRFKPAKVNAVVNGIRQMLPSRKWPLIILHNRRITGEKMDEPFNKALIDKWKTADALYATPTGSNDDWYWLYAAIKCRCLLVTNDEMRDHLFQLFGNDFFPKWKERHQVHFSFTETGPAFRMPPPCSVVIQETEEGEWHIPIVSELENEEERIWLCCSRTNSSLASEDSSDLQKESQLSNRKKREARIGVETQHEVETVVSEQGKHDHSKEELQELSTYITTLSNNHAYSLLPQLEAAEKLGDCSIDFQI